MHIKLHRHDIYEYYSTIIIIIIITSRVFVDCYEAYYSCIKYIYTKN